MATLDSGVGIVNFVELPGVDVFCVRPNIAL